jgi:hypothetical protein
MGSMVLAAPAAGNIILELDPGIPPFDTGGEGAGRAIYLTADETFDIKAVGIFGDISPELYDVVIYQGQGVGNPAGAVLQIATAASGGLGFNWNDIGIGFTFQAGQDYIVNWRPNDGGFNDWATTLRYFQWGNDPNDDVDLGVVTIRDGREGFDAESAGNTVAPFLRLQIPSPGALALFCLAGLGTARRRRLI